MDIAKVQQQLLQQRMGLQCEPTGPAPSSCASSPNSSSLPTDDDIAAHRDKYAKWFQMLRFGIAREVVELAMQREHIDPAELDGPHHVVVFATPNSASHAADKERDSRHPSALVVSPLPSKKLIRKRLHWQPKVHVVSTSIPCIWKSGPDAVQISKESTELMDALFEKPVVEQQPASQRESLHSKPRKAPRFIALIESKKAQNVAITLARVPLGFPALIQELVNMNPSVLGSAQLQSLLDMWPDQSEWRAIREYAGDTTRLGTVSIVCCCGSFACVCGELLTPTFVSASQQAEQFFVHADQVPRFRDKVACLIFKQEFPARVFELREAATLLIRGTNQVCSSAALQRVFQYILKSGNLLHVRASTTDAASANVHGFGLSSLAKLAQTKAFVGGGITFAQYLVQCIERDCSDAMHFPKEIHLIASCSKVSIPSLLAEKQSLDAGWKALVREAQIGLQEAESDALASSILQHFAYEVETELLAVQLHLDQLLESKARFVEYFHEHDAQEELDVLLGHLAQFTDEFALEHKRVQETKQLIADAIARADGGKLQSAPTSCA